MVWGTKTFYAMPWRKLVYAMAGRKRFYAMAWRKRFYAMAWRKRFYAMAWRKIVYPMARGKVVYPSFFFLSSLFSPLPFSLLFPLFRLFLYSIFSHPCSSVHSSLQSYFRSFSI